MATPPRHFENNSYYHIYNRGNRKQQIFLENRDCERFLEKTKEYKEKFSIKIVAYCLMPNHFHFLIQQLSDGSISKFFSNLCNSHSKYFNLKYETVGSQFQGRFKAKAIDKDEYLIHLSRYIHLNPLDQFLPGEIKEKLTKYPWSSLKSYIEGSENNIASPQSILDYFSKTNPTSDYEEFVLSNINIKINPEISHLTFEE